MNIDGWSHIEDGVDDFVLNFNLITSTYWDGSSIKFKPKFYKVDTDYNIDADPLDEVSYDLNISRRWDNYLQGYPIWIKNIEWLDDGVYKVVLSDFEYWDIEICKLAYDMDIDINISPKDDFKDIYTINNGELELFYWNFTKNISQFVSHEDILNMWSEGIAINEMAVNLSVFEEFQIAISSLDGNDIIYIDKDDGFENYGSSFYGEYLSGDKLDEIYNITTDDWVNSGNLYIFNYHTIDNSDYRDEFNVIWYIDASYNTYFHPLNPADIIYTMMWDRDDFSLDLIDNIEIRDLEDGIIYPCLWEDNCTIYDAIDNSEYDWSTLKIYLKLKDYNQVLNFYFTPFIYDSSPSLDIYDNLDYIRYATSYYKSYDFTPRIIDRLPINYYDLDDWGIDSFKIWFYDELWNEIYSIDNLDDLDSKYINYGDSKVYLKWQSRLDFINTLKNYKDQYIYYTLNLNFVFQDYPESDGVLYYDWKYFNSSWYFSSLFAALFDKTLDLSYLHDITDVCDEYDDGCGLDNIDYYWINSFTNSQTPNLAPFINQLQSDDLYFSKLYDFKIPDGDLSFDWLWVDDIELLDESDNNINFDPSKILICQIPIDSFVSPKGCMTYKDIKKLGILIPSETIFIYGLKPDLIGGYTEEIKVNIRIDIYWTIQLITPR